MHEPRRPWQLTTGLPVACAAVVSLLAVTLLDVAVGGRPAIAVLHLVPILLAGELRWRWALALTALGCTLAIVLVAASRADSTAGSPGDPAVAIAILGLGVGWCWRQRRRRVRSEDLLASFTATRAHLEDARSQLAAARSEQEQRSSVLLSVGEDLRQERTRLAAEVERRRHAEEHFRSMLESLPTAVVMVDWRGRIVMVNSEAESLFGHPREAALSLVIEDLVPVPSREAHAALRAEYVRAPNARRMGMGRDLHARHASGRLIPVEVGLSPMTTTDGEFVVSTVVDISARQEAERALRQALGDLERSNAELEQFAYVASHDLKEPLRAVASFLDLLRRRYGERLDETALGYVEVAIDGAVRMRTMIDDLLSFSRVGTHGGDPEPVDMGRVVDLALANLAVAVGECGAAIEVGPLPVVQGDESQLVLLMQNLIGNALKFRGESPPRVVVSAEEHGDAVVFRVADNGIGIDPEFRERVFQVFQRLHSREEYPGSGIGLAICRKVVERHGGTIAVEPAEGGGTMMVFRLRRSAIGGRA